MDDPNEATEIQAEAAEHRASSVRAVEKIIGVSMSVPDAPAAKNTTIVKSPPPDGVGIKSF